ncbi:MAG: S46 family peptidase [Acidobacteriota bacterium]|nr:S46 family peptidase [Acidobacteriota bacterium]MDW3228685.1 S46 family peptidase [Acidobacteriota bacterium]MDY0231506.1 S46 family peptidase [Candidatus Saccharicenans sp.]
MRFKAKLITGILFIGLLLLPVFSRADEGMWMPHQMKMLNLQELGLKMNPDDLYKKDGTGLMSAVVNLGGGTGEFVSPEGLILTNHHVAFGAIQRASSKKNDYITKGFLARNRRQEIPAQGYTADILLSYEEVTTRVLAKVKTEMDPGQKYEAIENAIKEIVAEAEKTGPDIRASVASMYSGNQYYLYRFKRIKDVRLVYAPPRDLGNYGGDIDNWMWPRHTCDFSFLRAYVSKDGVGVDYSPDNVPYQPKVWLKLSLEGLKEDDFTFVMGYPGRTYRNFTAAEIEYDYNSMVKRMNEFQDIINFIEAASKEDKETEIRYASLLKGLNNSLKNMQGKVEGMKKVDLINRKKEQEKEFLAWIKASPERQKKYGPVLKEIADFMKRYEIFASKNELLTSSISSFSGSTLLSQAYTIYRTVEELQKPDQERETSYQERNLPYIRQRIQLAERSYVLDTDREFFKHQLKKMLDLPAENIPGPFKALMSQKSEKAIEDYVDSLYTNTILADPKKRLELLNLKPAELLKTGDPFILLAAELEKELKKVREESKAWSQERADRKKLYEAALLEMKEGKMAPDANGTIRFTYGPVKGYSPRDAVIYKPITTLTGVMEKETGEFPFRVPVKLKELYQRRDFGRYEDQILKDVPACFLNTTNVTGGNSGSPTLNAKGEQVGIIFDMTYESVIGDYYIIPELQRSISVDIRYVIFITEKFSGANHIIKELSL